MSTDGAAGAEGDGREKEEAHALTGVGLFLASDARASCRRQFVMPNWRRMKA
jgi:hypothetical protein